MKAEKELLLSAITRNIDEIYQNSEKRIDTLKDKTQDFCNLEKKRTYELAESDMAEQKQALLESRDFLSHTDDVYRGTANQLEDHLQARFDSLITRRP